MAPGATNRELTFVVRPSVGLGVKAAVALCLVLVAIWSCPGVAASGQTEWLVAGGEQRQLKEAHYDSAMHKLLKAKHWRFPADVKEPQTQKRMRRLRTLALDNRLFHAAKSGDVEEARALLAKGANLGLLSYFYDGTALDTAAGGGHLEMVKFLMSKGARVDTKNGFGNTPLYYAAGGGHLEMVKFLLSKGARVDTKNGFGNTPLHYAAGGGHLEMVKFLMSKGARVDTKNKHGNTTLSEAALFGHLEVVKFLESKGVRVDTNNDIGLTPLSDALTFGHLEVAKFLVSKGALVHHSFVMPPFEMVHERFIIDLLNAVEGKDSMKILAGALSNKCFPKVAMWAAEAGYTSSSLPADSTTVARSCLVLYTNSDQQARVALKSWQTYIYPAAGIAAAALWVQFLEPCLVAADQEAMDPTESSWEWEQGAYLLVARASSRFKHPKLFFRFCEVMITVAFFMGFLMACIFRYWVWLPLMFVAFVVPTLISNQIQTLIHRIQALIRSPVTCVSSSNTWKGYSLSFVRVVLIMALVVVGVCRNPDVFGSLYDDGILNSLGDPRNHELETEFYITTKAIELKRKMLFMWRSATLHEDLGKMTQFITWFAPGLKEPLKILMNFDAAFISRLVFLMLMFFGVLYVIGLVFRLLGHLVCRCSCLDNPISDMEVSRLAKELAKTQTEDVKSCIERMNKDNSLEVKQLEGWGLSGLKTKLLFVAADVLFDANTILTMIISSNFEFAFVLTFIVARSTFKEMKNFLHLRQAIDESLERGMMHQRVIDLFEEEKGAEAFLSLIITAYSYPFCVLTAKQALIQWVSMLVSAYGLADFLLQKMDFPEYAPEMDTQEFRSLAVTPSEEKNQEVEGPKVALLQPNAA